ncbi:MAG: methylmalonyl-CoA epimerase [Candidatus Rokubacteria bacterium]|nr:methylmalonyl-CoA epimerase [Candidatus Rokubacteria bacterium]
MVRKIHHVGIVVDKLARAYPFYRDTLGLPLVKEAEVKDQGVRAALLAAQESEIELLEPIQAGTGVARFLEQRGEGLHHMCFETEDVDVALRRLKAAGVALIDETPRDGLAGRIAFLHPRACAGVLVELATPVNGSRPAPSPLRLKRVVIGSHDPQGAARIFQRLFDLPEQSLNGGPRAMLSVGRGALLLVPDEEVGGLEGLVALSVVAEDLPAVSARLRDVGAAMLSGAGELTVEPRSSHGVHLHISRFE